MHHRKSLARMQGTPCFDQQPPESLKFIQNLEGHLHITTPVPSITYAGNRDAHLIGLFL